MVTDRGHGPWSRTMVTDHGHWTMVTDHGNGSFVPTEPPHDGGRRALGQAPTMITAGVSHHGPWSRTTERSSARAGTPRLPGEVEMQAETLNPWGFESVYPDIRRVSGHSPCTRTFGPRGKPPPPSPSAPPSPQVGPQPQKNRTPRTSGSLALRPVATARAHGACPRRVPLARRYGPWPRGFRP